MEYVIRSYRRRMQGAGLVSFQVALKESDLFISVDRESHTPELERRAREVLLSCRNQLVRYLDLNPGFGRTLLPCPAASGAPRIVSLMAAASARAGVGPMAAVAGAVSEMVGRGLLRQAREVVVENGGDIFIRTRRPRVVAIFAGASPLSGKVGLRVDPDAGMFGVCTSSATVGPSLSLGRSDASVVLARSSALADAAASTLGNMVHSPDDFAKALNFVCGIKGVLGCVVIMGDRLGAMGQVELVPL